MNGQFDENGLFDIYSVWHVPFWQTQTLFLIVGICSVLFITVLLFLLYRYLSKKKMQKIPVWEIALNSLKKLQAKPYKNKEEGKYSYFELSQILKKYLSKRYSITIESYTDQELIAYIKNHDLPPIVKETLISLGQGVELIKFANQEAAQDQIQQDINQVMQMVIQTMPVKEPKKSKT